MKQKISFLYCQ